MLVVAAAAIFTIIAPNHLKGLSRWGEEGRREDYWLQVGYNAGAEGRGGGG